MKIGFLSWILDRPRTGIDNYLYNLVCSLIKMDLDERISLIHFKKSNDKIYDLVNDVTIGSLPFNLINPITLSNAIKQTNIDILHLPSHMMPQISPFFVNSDVKKVITIHDLIPLLYKDKLPTYYKFWALTLKLVKNRADFIITDSQNTKMDCIKHLKIPENKIEVVHLAPDPKFKPIAQKELVKANLRDKYNLTSKFVLYVGTVEIRKNISILLFSFYELLKKMDDITLVLIGLPGYGFDEILKTIDTLKISDKVSILGYLDDYELIKFYNTADIFVFPSLYEGFGLPPLEAMACGCPVITSKTSSLPEVVSDAGILVDPSDYKLFSEKMYEVLNNNYLKEDLSKKCLKQAGNFSWEKTANKTWKIYKKL